MTSFFMGHQMLGDVIGFCSAAHLYACKTGQDVHVWFDPRRRDVLRYFPGVVWQELADLHSPIDCGPTPSMDEWQSLNGVSRFYRFMDPAMQPVKSFDIHFCCCEQRPACDEKRIGVITHSNLQGPSNPTTLNEMITTARDQFPDHRIGCIGGYDNTYVPAGVEDWRDSHLSIVRLIENVRDLSLLISPHSGPCYVAAGWRIPSWVIKSKDAFWDCSFNFDQYKIERWWEYRENHATVFDRIYQSGGWNGMGSGPGSRPENNVLFIQFLNNLIQLSPGINSILDVGCGDWQLMSRVDLTNKSYLGVDVSKTVINANQRQYSAPNIAFQCVDACTSQFREHDLVIVRDVLQHLPDCDVHHLLRQVRKWGRSILIVNDFTDTNGADIPVGQWRALNVLQPPFSFPGVTVGYWNGKHVALSTRDGLAAN